MLGYALILIGSAALMIVNVPPSFAILEFDNSSAEESRNILPISRKDSSSTPFTKDSIGQGLLASHPSKESIKFPTDGQVETPTYDAPRVFYGRRYRRNVEANPDSGSKDVGSISSKKTADSKSEDQPVLNVPPKFKTFLNSTDALKWSSINHSTPRYKLPWHRPLGDNLDPLFQLTKLSNKNYDKNVTTACDGHEPCLSEVLPLLNIDVNKTVDVEKKSSVLVEDYPKNQTGIANNGTDMFSSIVLHRVADDDGKSPNLTKLLRNQEGNRTSEMSYSLQPTDNLYFSENDFNTDNKSTDFSLRNRVVKITNFTNINKEKLKGIAKWSKIWNDTLINSSSAQINFDSGNATIKLESINHPISLEQNSSYFNSKTYQNNNQNQYLQNLDEIQISMQQDEVQETSTRNDIASNSVKQDNEYDFNKFPNIDSKIQENDYLSKKTIITTVQSITTADAHMNDPPFRGPHVSQDVDNFSEDKKFKKVNDFSTRTVKHSPDGLLNVDYYPDWRKSDNTWGIAWRYHCYILSGFFMLLAFYSIVSILRVKCLATLLKMDYYIALNFNIFIICVLRAAYLLYEPFTLPGKHYSVTSSILLRITLPITTATFNFLVLSLLNSTNARFFPPRFQKVSVFATVSGFFITLFFGCELLVGFAGVHMGLILACKSVLALWGGISSVFYFFMFKQLLYRALWKQSEMIRFTFTQMHIDGAQLPKKLPKPTFTLSVKISLVAAVFQILLCCLLPYGTIYIEGLFPKLVLKPSPFLWYGYQLMCRILELLMCLSMSFTATQSRSHYAMDGSSPVWTTVLLRCCCCNKSNRIQEIEDFEAHSDNYANSQGLRNVSFDIPMREIRSQTNSLPTFRTPILDINNTLPMRSLPYSGRHTNHPSAVSLLSYYRSKRTLSLSTTEGLEELETTFCSQAMSTTSDGKNNSLRPASMLYKDNGFIRFRQANDPAQPMEMSDEDEHIIEEADTSSEGADSTRVNIGSSFKSVLECDVVQNTLSPFFQMGYNRRFRKMSRISLETTDYSADVSSDQLSNVVNLRNGLSTSALDFNTRKYGSTCSSESAANSFDVTFFLNDNSSPEIQNTPTSTTPVSLRIGSAYRSETEDDKTSSVEGHEVMLRSVSPIVKRASSGKLSLNLSLLTAVDGNHSNGHVNVACGTEDITPDSAVYLDLHLTEDASADSEAAQRIFQNNLNIPFPSYLSKPCYLKSPDRDSSSASDTSAKLSSSPTTTSQSLSDLRTSNSYSVLPRSKRNSRGLFCKLRGSTFSLNSVIHGYELMQPQGHSESHHNISEHNYESKGSKLCASDRRPRSEAQLHEYLTMTPLEEFRNRGTATCYGLGDSGLLGDCQDCGIALIDVASQTEDSTLQETTHNTYAGIPSSVEKDALLSCRISMECLNQDNV